MRLPRLQITLRRMMTGALVAVFLLSLVLCLIDRLTTGVQIAFADEQTAIFEEMRRETGKSAAVDVSYLEYALWYYPSGSKQTKGSSLDRVVERARQCALREIIAILRCRTGKDFGDDPRRWIEGLRADGNNGPKPRA